MESDKKINNWLENNIKPYNPTPKRQEKFRTGVGTINKQRKDKRSKKPKKHEGNFDRYPNLAQPFAEFIHEQPPIEKRHIHQSYGYWGFSYRDVPRCTTPQIRHEKIHRMQTGKMQRDPVRKFKITLSDYDLS